MTCLTGSKICIFLSVLLNASHSPMHQTALWITVASCLDSLYTAVCPWTSLPGSSGTPSHKTWADQERCEEVLESGAKSVLLLQKMALHPVLPGALWGPLGLRSHCRTGTLWGWWPKALLLYSGGSVESGSPLPNLQFLSTAGGVKGVGGRG